ncbi:MAG: sigK [Marmoricola sp.]|nr:sigK [Marmoricola sp.]
MSNPAGFIADRSLVRSAPSDAIAAVPLDPSCAGWREHLNDLLGRAERGDSDAFMQFYDCTSTFVYRVMRTRVASSAVAEKATRALYLDAWERAASYRASGLSPLAWLLAGLTFAPVLTAC